MAFEELELGLRGASGTMITTTNEELIETDRREASGRKGSDYNRQSMPSAWAGNNDNVVGTNKLTIGQDENEALHSNASSETNTPRVTPTHSTDVKDAKTRNAEIGERGTEQEVRRDGQYVHFRR